MPKPLPGGSSGAGKDHQSNPIGGGQSSGPLPKRPSLPKSLSGTGIMGKAAAAAAPLSLAGKAVKGLKNAATGAGKLASPEGRSDLGKAALAKGKSAAFKAAKGAAKLVAKAGRKALKAVIKKLAIACVGSGICLVAALILVGMLAAFMVVSGSLLIIDDDNVGGDPSGGAGGGGYVQEFGLAAGNPESQNVLAIILDHWRLDSIEATEPVSLLERWLIGGQEVDDGYRLHTGATDKEPCENLWDNYTPPSSDYPPIDPFDDTLWNPALCDRIWAAAVAWEHTLKELEVTEGLLDLSSTDGFPIRDALQRKGHIYPWWEPADDGSTTTTTTTAPLPEFARIPDGELPGVLAVVLWFGSGFGTVEDESDGFALVFFDETDEHDAPYCGLNEHYLDDDEAEDYDNRVLLPVECLEPPSIAVCAAIISVPLAASFQRPELQAALTETQEQYTAEPSLEPDDSDAISGIPHCDAALATQEAHIENIRELNTRRGPDEPLIPLPDRYEWQALWWREGDMHEWNGNSWVPVSDDDERSARCRPQGEHQSEKWVMGLCADLVYIDAIFANNTVTLSERVDWKALPVEGWGWSPLRPIPPTFGPLLGAVLDPYSDRELNERVAWRAFAAADAYGWEPPGLSDDQETVRSDLPAEGENGCARLWLVMQEGLTLNGDSPCPLRNDIDESAMNSWGWAWVTDADLSALATGNRGSLGVRVIPDCEAPTPVTENDIVETVTVELPIPSKSDGEGNLTERVTWMTVAPCLEDSIKGLWRRAYWAGVVLTGGAYRNISEQIDLRKAHCGESDEAIWLTSAALCVPPTAVPGRSRHNMGLAIDFSGCNNDDCQIFGWLQENAADFGLENLASEKWHWSVDGN